MRGEKDDDQDVFVDDHLTRKQSGAAKRAKSKTDKREAGIKMRAVVKSKDRWRYNPNTLQETDDDFCDDDGNYPD